MISADVRQAESQIDECIRNIPLWNTDRDVLLQGLMTLWRDGLELAQMQAVHALMFEIEDGLQRSIAAEYLIVSGVYQSLKWAMQFATVSNQKELSVEALAECVTRLGGFYQMLVDALKLGAHGRVHFSVDHNSKSLTVYEGGDLSGYDAAIIGKDHITLPFYKQTPLIDDADQLTTKWTAGEYREYWRWLRSIAKAAEKETIMAQAGPLVPMEDVMKRPVIVDIPAPPSHLAAIQEDLTLTAAKALGPLLWKIDSWHDCPLVQVGNQLLGVSSAIITLAEIDDYMLRVAVLNDPGQYEKVSGLREERMIDTCKREFSAAGWQFTPHYLLHNPAKEIDGYATKGDEVFIVQLKSTLRPQSPWEAYKRNTDVIEGINHTAEIVERIGGSAMGIVITDGYAGDFATWRESLAKGIPVGTLADLDLILKEPNNAFHVLADRAGIKADAKPESVAEREIELCGWTLRIVDEQYAK